MSIMETFTRSWDITKQTFKVIRADKEIMLFPILSSLFSIIFFILMAIPFLAGSVASSVLPESAGATLNYILIFVFYLGVSFLATFFNVAVVFCAKKRFQGGDPTFMEGLKAALSRIHLIFLWSLVSATVGVILRAIENAAKKTSGIGNILLSILVGILGLAWSIITLFVVPALVIDNVGPFEAIKHSVQTLKKTWGESLIRYYGLGTAQGIFFIGGLFLFGGLAALSLFMLGNFILFLAFMGIFILYAVLISIVFSTADSVFNTALYLYAKTGKVPSVYSQDTMKNAFKSTKSGPGRI